MNGILFETSQQTPVSLFEDARDGINIVRFLINVTTESLTKTSV